MKLLKLLLLLLTGLSLPVVVRAQARLPEQSLPFNSVKTSPADLVNMLQGMANPHYKVLEKPAPVYHQPADTLNGRYAFKLTPGTKVYIKKYVSEGFIITLFYGNVEEYYLPAKLVAGLPTQIEI